MEAVWQKLTCSTCGGQLEEKNGKLVCKYCRSIYHAIEKISEAEVIALNNAAADRKRRLFDDALEKYELILKDYPDNAEANWGAFLCAYGIIYEKDYNGEYKPTCHRVNECPIKKSPYYAKLAEENKKRADEIETLRLKILEEVKKIQPYDVFICYKQNEDNANENAPKIPTRESKWARDIYEMLSRDLGLKVFFAEKSLSGTNADYEPHIYAALRSAKLMVVLVASLEHVNAVWVKNEWNRYAKYIREGEDKTLRVVYDGIEPYSLPKELQNKQAISHDDMNWSESLANSVRELFNKAPELGRKEYKEVAYTRKKVTQSLIEKRELPVFKRTTVSASEKSQLQTIEEIMSLGKFKMAVANLNSVIEANRACSRGYLDLFLCENECADTGAFINGKKTVASFENYENALASAETEKEKKSILDILVARISNAPTLALFEEFAHLPNTTPEQTRIVMLSVYGKAKATCDCALFDALLKIVTDTDLFIEWNFEFAKCLFNSFEQNRMRAGQYFDAVLNIDEGHQESLLHKYMLNNGVHSIEGLKRHCLELEDYSELEKLYNYGWFDSLSRNLFDACVDAICDDRNVGTSLKLAEFLLSIIPKKQDKTYVDWLQVIIESLFEINAYDKVGKYIDQLLIVNPNNDEAYFQKVMMKYKVNRVYDLLKATDELMEDEDFINAVNAYSKKPNITYNLYMRLYKQYEYIKGLLKSYELTLDEYQTAWLKEASLQEFVDLPKEKLTTRAAERKCDKKIRAAEREHDKKIKGISLGLMLPILTLFIGGLLLVYDPSIILKWIHFGWIIAIYIVVALAAIVGMFFYVRIDVSLDTGESIKRNCAVTMTGAIIALVMMIVGLSTVTSHTYSLRTARDFMIWENMPYAYKCDYVIENDIDFGGKSYGMGKLGKMHYVTYGSMFNYAKNESDERFSFEGTIDGKGHTLSNIYYVAEDSECDFGICISGDVENLMIKDSVFKFVNAFVEPGHFNDDHYYISGVIDDKSTTNEENCFVENVTVFIMSSGIYNEEGYEGSVGRKEITINE